MSSCPHSKYIDDYLLNRLGEKEKMRFEEHFFNCRTCFEDLKAREEVLRVIKNRSEEIFARDRDADTEKAGVGETRRALRFKPWWAAAAAAAAAALLLIMYLPHRPELPPVFTLGEDEAVRGESLELLSPAGESEAAPRAFEWRPLSRKARYILSLYDGELIWSGETEDTRLDLPGEIRERLKPGRIYFWQVKAYSPPGTLITSSQKAEFRFDKD